MMRAALWLAVAAGAAGGCNRQLAYVYQGSIGIDLAAAPTEGNMRLAIGVDRQTSAIVPKTGDKDPTGKSDAMAIAAVSRMHLEGLDKIEVGHAIATGEPAVWVAQHPDEWDKVVNQVFTGKTVKEGKP